MGKHDKKLIPNQDENVDLITTIPTKFWKTDIPDQEFLDLFNFNGVAFRGCVKYVGDVSSDKYTVNNEQFETIRTDLQLDKKINYATERAYISGISFIYFGAADNKELSEPLETKIVPDFLQVIPKSWFFLDNENNVLLDEASQTYTIFKKGGGDVNVHESRLIKINLREDFKSSYLPAYRALTVEDNNLWSGGQANFRGGAGLLHAKITNPGKTKVGGKTISEVDLVKSSGVFNNINAETSFISDDRYELSFKGTEGSRAPFKDIDEATLLRCSIAMRIPYQLLTGVAAGAITGSETNLKDYFGEIQNVREDFMSPILNTLSEMMGFNELEIEYETLFEETDIEKAGIFKTDSESLSILKTSGIISGSSAVKELNDKHGTNFEEGEIVSASVVDSKHPTCKKGFKLVSGKCVRIAKDSEHGLRFPYKSIVSKEFTKEQADEMVLLASLSIDDYEEDEFEHIYFQFRDFVTGTIEFSELNQHKNIMLLIAEKSDEVQETEAEKELRNLKEMISNAGFTFSMDAKPFFPKLLPPRVSPWEQEKFMKLEKKAFNVMNRVFNKHFDFLSMSSKLKGAIMFVDSIPKFIEKDAEKEANIEIDKEVEAFKVEAQLALSPVLIEGIEAAILEAEKILKSPVSLSDRNKQIQKQIQEQAMEKVVGTSEDMRKDLKRELEAAMLNEVSAKKAAKRFREVVSSDFADRYKNRLDVIAQQEMNTVFNSAAQATYEDSGIVEFNQWITAGDSRVRPEHAAIHGQVVKVGEQFSLGVIRPPEGVRCRCGIVPFFPEDNKL